MSDFHFLRPLWLLLLILAPLLPMLVRRTQQGLSGWSRIMPPALLNPLLSRTGASSGRSRSPLPWLLLTLVTLSVALSGPTWRKAPTPLEHQNDSLVIVLDLSLSMLATDVEPDRLTLAKRKIRDLLKARDGSFTGLVVYAGDAHVVTPLTDDRHTIETLLGVLDPLIMPASGNRADLGIKKAKALLDQGAPGKGQMVLISDAVPEQRMAEINNLLKDSSYPLKTLVVGTEAGGPMPIPKRGFIRDNGDIVMARAEPEGLASLAANNGGSSHQLTLDDTDIKALNLRARDSNDWQASDEKLTVERWQDDGYWLLWLAVPLALLCWRRGALLLLVMAIAPLAPRPAMAFDWHDLWVRPDQKGEALIKQDPKQAIDRFSDPDWRASAQYRAGDFGAAARTWSHSDSPDATYNRANALARDGKLEEALSAYNKVLEEKPDDSDARFNRDLVRKLLEQKQQQTQNQKQSGQQNQNQQQQGDKKQDSNNQSGDRGQKQGNQSQKQPESEGQNSASSKDQSSSDEQQQKQPKEPGQANDEAGKKQEQSRQKQPGASASQQQEEAGKSPQNQTAKAPDELDTRPLTQSQEQWLRRIPDDPGGLLRRKFLQQYRESDTPTDKSDTPW